MKWPGTLILLLLFDFASISAQQPSLRFEHIGKEDGLPANNIEHIFQDGRGFMWFGTREGLCRYDGRQFRVFRHNDSDANSISNNYVKHMIEDGTQRLWIATLDGLNSFDPATERFTRYYDVPGYDDGGPSPAFNRLLIDHTNRLWMGMRRRGIKHLDLTSMQFTAFDSYPPDSSDMGRSSVIRLYEDQNRTIWISSTVGLFAISAGGRRLVEHDISDGDSPSLQANNVYSMLEDSYGRFWLGTWQRGLVQYDEKQGIIKHYLAAADNPGAIAGNQIAFILEESVAGTPAKSLLWLGTENGLSILDTQTGFASRHVHDINDPYSLSGDMLHAGFIDRGGSFWLGNPETGINKHSPLMRRFPHFNVSGDMNINPGLNSVYSLCEEQETGVLWVGSGGGLSAYDPRAGRWKHFVHDFENSAGVPAHLVLALVEDKTGGLLVGSRGGGVSKLTRSKGHSDPLEGVRFQKLLTSSESETSARKDQIFSLLQDKENTLWVGTGMSLNRVDPHSGAIVIYRPEPNDSTSLSHQFIETIMEDRDGGLWVGTFQGLNKFNRKTGSFTHFLHDRKNPNSLSSNNINTLCEDSFGNLWVGTRNGLNRISAGGSKITRFSENDGLANTFIHGILSDGVDNLWASTMSGLTQIRLTASGDSVAFHNYSAHEGLVKEGFNTGAYFRAADGELLFGGPSGFNRFDPLKLETNANIPDIVITAFSRLGEPQQLENDMRELPRIELTHKDYFFSFEFAALDYWAPSKNRYQYRMEGMDPGWIDAGTRNTATYTNLDAGTYIFRVRGSNSDGIWNSDGAALQVVVYPPFWKSNWAYFIYLLLLGGLLISWRRYDLKRQSLKHELALDKVMLRNLKDLDQLKSRFFANISHEFRTPLTLIKGPAEQMAEEEPNPGWRENIAIIRRNAERLLTLINQLLDLSKLESGNLKLDKQESDLVSFVNMLVQSFESLAEQKKLNLIIRAQPGKLITRFDSEKMQQVIFNLLSNAMKFTGEDGTIIVEIDHNRPIAGTRQPSDGNSTINPPPATIAPSDHSNEDEEYVSISVIDSGIGIPASQIPYVFDRFYQVDSPQTRAHGGTGIGLALTKELVELHGGTISVDSVEGRGTTFTLKFPLTGGGHNQGSGRDGVEFGVRDAGLRTVQSEIPNPKSPIRNPQSETRNQPLVLVVEDNTDVREYICQSLGTEYRIVEAVNGREGVQKALKIVPDLVISDVMMPEMDGFELCDKLKREISTSHIPIILLTARAADKDRIAGLERGADDYLIKPFNARELKIRMRNLINIRRGLQEKFRREFLITPEEIRVASIEDEFLVRACRAVEANIADPDYKVSQFTRDMAMSRPSLHRKLIALTALNPGDFIRSIRLKRAAYLLKQHSGNITDVAYDVGFTSSAYFTKCFKAQFGVSPNKYRHLHA